jgi:hypothetical protein
MQAPRFPIAKSGQAGAVEAVLAVRVRYTGERLDAIPARPSRLRGLSKKAGKNAHPTCAGSSLRGAVFWARSEPRAQGFGAVLSSRPLQRGSAWIKRIEHLLRARSWAAARSC